jgi:RNA polymerase sigma-70 factor, ECF subfamily
MYSGSVVSRLDAFLVEARPWLLARARGLCRDTTDAEDLVQEACLRFVRSAPVDKLDADEAREAWLIKTMTNCFYDLCRKRKAEKRGEGDPGLEKLSMAQPEEPKAPYEDVTDEMFAEAMDKLSPKLRETFKLRAVGLKHREIAAKQGISMGLVAKRLHDAGKKLRKLLSVSSPEGET